MPLSHLEKVTEISLCDQISSQCSDFPDCFKEKKNFFFKQIERSKQELYKVHTSQ